MTTNFRQLLRGSAAFNKGAIWAYRSFALVVDLYVRWKFGSEYRFTLLPNPAHRRLQIEGIKPLVICEDEDCLLAGLQMAYLDRWLRKLPFMARLSLMTRGEMEIYSKRAYAQDGYRQLKSIQKLLALMDQFEGDPEHREKWIASISFILKEHSEPAGSDLNVETAKAATLRVIEKTARQWLTQEKIDKSQIVAINSFGSHVWRKTLGQPATLSDLTVSAEALYFWSMVTPGLYDFTGPGVPRAEKLIPLWESNVTAEYILRVGECRLTGHTMPQWMDEDVEEVMQARQMNSPLALSESNKELSAEPFCRRPFNQISVTCEGDVFMCCWQNKPHMSPGNVARATPEEVWNSKTYQIARSDILAGRMPAVCEEANGCPYHYTKNQPSYFQFDPKKGPGFIDINLPNFACNIGGPRPSEKNPACIMCERNTPGYRFQDAKDFDLVLKRLSTLMPQLHALHVQGVAEPFWKDAIFDVLDKLDFDPYKEQITVTTVTNGTVFTPERQKRFLERCGPTVVNISVDAATSDTYRKIRRLNIWDTLVKNILHYGELRKTYPKALFRIQNNINLLNVHEVKGMVQMAAQAGVDSLELNPTGGNPVEYLVNASNAHIFKRAEEEARREAERLGLMLEILRPLDLGLAEVNQD